MRTEDMSPYIKPIAERIVRTRELLEEAIVIAKADRSLAVLEVLVLMRKELS